MASVVNLRLSHGLQVISKSIFAKKYIPSFYRLRSNLCSGSEKPSTDFQQKEVPETELTPLEKELSEKVETLTQEVEIYKDKYQRTLADRENVRQRLDKQISDAKLFGIQSFCKDLLEVTDVFRKAIESVPEAKIQEGDAAFTNLYNGVCMTENQLLSVFRRHGLQRITPEEGNKFDPSEQEAMFEVEDQEKTPGSIALVLRTGWKLHDRCVRSAQVGVVKQ